MKVEMRFLATLFLGFTMTTTSWAKCPADLAIYHHGASDKFTLTFSKQKNPKAWSNIEADLSFGMQRLKFEFTASNGYPMEYLVSLDEKLINTRDNLVLFFDKNLKALSLPQAGEAAPEYIVMPEMGLWLKELQLKSNPFLPPGMWKLSGCQK